MILLKLLLLIFLIILNWFFRVMGVWEEVWDEVFCVRLFVIVIVSMWSVCDEVLGFVGRMGGRC